MTNYFFRPSALANEQRFLAWRLLGLSSAPSTDMKRGTIAEQIALRGTAAVEPEWVFVPASLPLNDVTGKRFATWKAWQEATGINPDADNAIDMETWSQACAAASAIRESLPNEFEWQKPGTLQVSANVPDGFQSAIVGTCDLLLPDAVWDIKVVSDPNPKALEWQYKFQLSAYCWMHDKPNAAILAVFPLDDDKKVWSSKIVEIPVLTMEELDAQCQRLVVAYNRALNVRSFQTDLTKPFSFSSSPIQPF